MKLFCFGYGYSAEALAARLQTAGDWTVEGTRTDPPAGRADLVAYRGDGRSEAVAQRLKDATHVLISIPPDGGVDPALRDFADDIAAARNIRWIGYLSTIGVYGDHGGAWIDETTPAAPANDRTRARLAAEQGWQALAERTGKRVAILRLPGIYGPGRSVIEQLRAGTARRIVKPGQVFNRIHVADIAGAVHAAMSAPPRETLVNVCDDEPAAASDVVAYGAQLLGMTPPPEVPITQANLSPMGVSFYAECKRVRNERLKRVLGYTLRYPTYREGLAAIAAGDS
jgi:nucleoside-diphosphate-sugar epimerase